MLSPTLRLASLSAAAVALAVLAAPRPAAAAECGWNYPVGVNPGAGPDPLYNGHPVKGTNFINTYGYHLGSDYWSGFGCTDLGQPVYAVGDGEVAEIVDALGSYLDVVVIRHDIQGIGNVYSMYGHIARDGGLSEGAAVSAGQQIGTIDDVTAYFTPCHVHFELLSEAAYQQGPFCNGCEQAGFHVSPGYDKQAGVTDGVEATGDAYIEVNDGIDGNRWYYTDAFIDARLGNDCSECGDGSCDPDESAASCPQDCDTGGDTTTTSDSGGTGWDGGSESTSDEGLDTGTSETGGSGGESGSEGVGDTSGDELGDDFGDEGYTSWGTRGEPEGCACAAATEDQDRRGLLGGLALLALLGLRRRSRSALKTSA